MSTIIRDPKRYRLAEMRRILNLGDEIAPSAVVRAWYTDAADRSVRVRGFLRPSWFAHAESDLIEIGGWDQPSAEAWALEVGGQYPHEAENQSATVSTIRDMAASAGGAK